MENRQCECEAAGYCSRHDVYKSNIAYSGCKNNRDVFLQFEMMHGKIKKPSLIQQAQNLGEATLEHVADGLVNVDDDEYDRRMSICHSCPLFIASAKRCMLCGCYLETKGKWRSGHCPDNPPRW